MKKDVEPVVIEFDVDAANPNNLIVESKSMNSVNDIYTSNNVNSNQDNNFNITGRRIKTLRNARKLTQSQLAERVDLKKAIISRYENGSAIPGRSSLEKIADVFKVSVDYLLGNIDTFQHVDNETLLQYKKLFTTLMTKPKEEREKIITILSELLK